MTFIKKQKHPKPQSFINSFHLEHLLPLFNPYNFFSRYWPILQMRKMRFKVNLLHQSHSKQVWKEVWLYLTVFFPPTPSRSRSINIAKENFSNPNRVFCNIIFPNIYWKWPSRKSYFVKVFKPAKLITGNKPKYTAHSCSMIIKYIV